MRRFVSDFGLLLPRRPTIFAFGDSHSICGAQARGIHLAYAGPVTLNRLGRPGEAESLLAEAVKPTSRLLRRLQSILRVKSIRQGDAVLVFAGEIDVRCHVQVQVKREGRSEEDVVEGLAGSALRCVEGLRTTFPIQVWLCAVIPPAEGVESPDWPFRGTLEERIRWTNSLNRKLELAMDAGYVRVLDPYVRFRDDSGALDVKFRDASVHLSDGFGRQAFGPLVREIRDPDTRPSLASTS